MSEREVPESTTEWKTLWRDMDRTYQAHPQVYRNKAEMRRYSNLPPTALDKAWANWTPGKASGYGASNVPWPEQES